jgi:hypothetical protein
MKDTHVNSLGLAPQYHKLVLNRTKTSTVRLGHVTFADANLTFTFEKKSAIQVEIQEVIHGKCLKDLTEIDAEKDGFESLSNLKQALLSFYPSITGNSEVTIVCFKLGKQV